MVDGSRVEQQECMHGKASWILVVHSKHHASALAWQTRQALTVCAVGNVSMVSTITSLQCWQLLLNHESLHPLLLA